MGLALVLVSTWSQPIKVLVLFLFQYTLVLVMTLLGGLAYNTTSIWKLNLELC